MCLGVNFFYLFSSETQLYSYLVGIFAFNTGQFSTIVSSSYTASLFSLLLEFLIFLLYLLFLMSQLLHIFPDFKCSSISYILGTFEFVFQFTNSLLSSVINCSNLPLNWFYVNIILFLEILLGSFLTLLFQHVLFLPFGFCSFLFWGNILKYFPYCFLLPIQLLKFFSVLCLLILFLVVVHLFLWFVVFDYELISSKTWFLEKANLPLALEEESCQSFASVGILWVSSFMDQFVIFLNWVSHILWVVQNLQCGTMFGTDLEF